MLPAIHRCPAFSLPPAVDPLPHGGGGDRWRGCGGWGIRKAAGESPHRRDGGRRPLLRVGCKGVAGRVEDGSRTHGSQGVPRQWPVAPLERAHPALGISRQGDRSSQYPDNASFIAFARTHATYPGRGRPWWACRRREPNPRGRRLSRPRPQSAGSEGILPSFTSWPKPPFPTR